MKQELPTSAREALARQGKAEAHPSADLLSGFVERALSAAEKERVTAHLAACSECRETVFLAGAAAGAAQAPAEEYPAARQNRWAIWKWAAPALAAMIIVAAVLVERPNGSHPPVVSETAAVKAPVPPLPSNSAADAARDRLTAAAPDVRQNSPQGSPKQKTEAAKRSPTSAMPIVPGQDAVQFRNEVSGRDVAPAAAPVAPSFPVHSAVATTTASAPPSLAKAKSAAPAASADEATPQPSPVPGGVIGGTIGRNASPVTSSPAASTQKAATAGGLMRAPLGKNGLSLASRNTLSATDWQIAQDGHLQYATPSGAWVNVLDEQPVTFHSVAVIGSDVWAGGSGGALFHSSDRGEHWTRIPLGAGDQTERGTLTSIRFDTPLQGTVISDSGATWSTSDGGKTWARQ